MQAIAKLSLPSTTPRTGLARVARGFTLIELMVVVAIVAILVGIAYPAYNDAVRKSRRGQAKADLVELAQVLERYNTVNGTYVTDAAWVNPITQSPRTGTAHYAIAIEGATAVAFLLSATPVGGQATDTRCMTLTLTAAGQKGVRDGATGTWDQCW